MNTLEWKPRFHTHTHTHSHRVRYHSQSSHRWKTTRRSDRTQKWNFLWQNMNVKNWFLQHSATCLYNYRFLITKEVIIEVIVFLTVCYAKVCEICKWKPFSSHQTEEILSDWFLLDLSVTKLFFILLTYLVAFVSGSTCWVLLCEDCQTQCLSNSDWTAELVKSGVWVCNLQKPAVIFSITWNLSQLHCCVCFADFCLQEFHQPECPESKLCNNAWNVFVPNRNYCHPLWMGKKYI